MGWLFAEFSGFRCGRERGCPSALRRTWEPCCTRRGYALKGRSRVVELPKNEQRLTELLDGVEGAHPEQVLLERADEALGAAIPLGGPYEGGRTRDAQEGELLLEGVGHVLRS